MVLPKEYLELIEFCFVEDYKWSTSTGFTSRTRLSPKYGRIFFSMMLLFCLCKHASLLIDMGCTPLLVAERLGHERVQTTMETYSHLYPNKQTEVADQLDMMATKDDGYEKIG